ncbi:hypothetical protein OF83DRAFT_1146565 [Amylostereum chailletii]|nr:hypothetical protein OF83DRAFT_1146565 [Amylostereum chailletii]
MSGATLYVGILFETALFGANTVLLLIACSIVLRRRCKSSTMIVCSCAMYALSATVFVSSALSVGRVAVSALGLSPAENAWIDPANAPAATTLVALVINCFIGDFVIIWRSWLLWNRRTTLFVIPSGLVFSATVIGISAACYTCIRNNLGPSPIFHILLLVFVVLTLTTNAFVTALLLNRAIHHYQLWKTLGEAISHSHIYRVLLILVESGALYCATWVILLCFIRIGNHQAHYSIATIIAQLTTLYPISVVVLASLQNDAHKTSLAAVSGTFIFASNSSSDEGDSSSELSASADHESRDAVADATPGMEIVVRKMAEA